jgi:4-amino-4-deoxy-L-arabinose transferase-like glycosyltransferase
MERKSLFLLLIILVIASFFRLWQLDSIPPGLYPDVAINGNEALETLKTGNFKLFYPENNGREGLMMWLIALSFSIFGVSIWSIKIVAATFGILTVLGLYLLTNELFSFNSPTFQHSNPEPEPSVRYGASTPTIISLLASFFLATSFWHTNFSRIGFRAILLPFVLVFSFYFLFKGFRTRKILNFIASGIFFGLGFYTYISFRFAILILPAIFIPFWIIYKKENLQKKFIIHTSYFLLLAFFIALPIGLYFLRNPQDFVGRAAPVSIFATKNPIKEFFKSLILHLAMFNFYGDPNWRHNFSGSPMLPWPLGILFLIGLILSFKEIFKKSNYQKENYQLLSIFYFLLSTFFVMLFPGILTYEGIPHSLRVIGVIPVVYIFVAIGGLKTYQFFERNTKRKKLLISACFLFLIAMGIFEFNKYFFDWGRNKEVKGAFTERFLKEGEFLTSLPKDIQKYVIVNEPGVPVPWPDGIPMPAQTIMFIENMKYGRVQSTYLLPKDLDKIKINEKRAVIVSMAYDQNLFNEISRRFPQGKIQKENSFWIYKINFEF